jgi:hypothetical protein
MKWKKKERTPNPYLNILAFYKEAITNNSAIIPNGDCFNRRVLHCGWKSYGFKEISIDI